MIKERGQVTRIEGDGVWVKTIAQSTCNSCQAKNGCGQKLLNRLGVPTSAIWASLASPETGDLHDLQEGDWVEVGVEEGAVVFGSLLAYGLPILLLVGGAALGQSSAIVSAIGAIGGLTIGALISRVILRDHFGPKFFQPVVLARASDAAVVKLLPSQAS